MSDDDRYEAEMSDFEKCPWYVTATAVREFMRIARLADTDANFEKAEEELMCICEQEVRLRKDEGHRQIWQTKKIEFFGVTVYRLELTVSMQLRDEGNLPQLVRVRNR